MRSKAWKIAFDESVADAVLNVFGMLKEEKIKIEFSFQQTKQMGFNGVILSSTFVSMLLMVSAADNFLIDCGTNSSTVDGARKWVGDSSASNVTFSPVGIPANLSKVDTNATYPKVYTTARIFTSVANYTFKVSPGRHWLRLHFYPFSFMNFSVNSSVFSVNVGPLKLLSNLNVSNEISNKNNNPQYSASGGPKIVQLMKEYSINVANSSAQLVVTFTPESGSFAFISAIEVVSMPEDIFPTSSNLVGSSPKKSSLDLSSSGVETMYRLNVGGSSVTPQDDSGLSRTWEEDKYYIYSLDAGSETKNVSAVSYNSPNDSYIAPLVVYETAREMTSNLAQVVNQKINISWSFAVDPNFDYLVRFHFCELVFDKVGMRVFGIYINNQTADPSFDVLSLADAKNRAIYSDYTDTSMGAGVNTMWIQIGPNPSLTGSDNNAILNGLEIFKLSRKDNLAGSPTKLQGAENPSEAEQNSILWPVIGGAIGGAVLIGAVIFVGLCLFCGKKKPTPVKPHSPGWLPLFLHAGSESAYTTKASKGTVNSGSTMVAQKGMLEEIIDPKLAGAYSPGSLRKFGEIAEKCLADDGKNRPSMGDVLWNLEYILQLQEAADRSLSLANSSTQLSNFPSNLPHIRESDENSESTLIREDQQDQQIEARSVGESEEGAGALEFSQLVKPMGRTLVSQFSIMLVTEPKRRKCYGFKKL
ncbi:hypothetical protein SUGI_1125950 [Cryptomeria japonica]|nr:hypothetical protein SUGI_1125950 [Cryptomeria japonica]